MSTMIMRSPHNGRANGDISGPINKGHEDPLSWKDHLSTSGISERQFGAINIHPSEQESKVMVTGPQRAQSSSDGSGGPKAVSELKIL